MYHEFIPFYCQSNSPYGYTTVCLTIEGIWADSNLELLWIYLCTGFWADINFYFSRINGKSMTVRSSDLWRKYRIITQNDCTIFFFWFYKLCMGDSVSLHPWEHLVLSLFYIDYFNKYVIIWHCDLNLHLNG